MTRPTTQISALSISNPRAAAGFTLIELVVAISISTILVGFTAMLISAPVDGYLTQSSRSTLNESAEMISRSIERDLRSALPNSVRIRSAGTRAIIEMLAVDKVVFYGATGAAGPWSAAERELDFSIPAGDGRFSVFGRVDPDLAPASSYVYPARYLVVNNAGSPGLNDAYRLQRVVTPTPVALNVDRDLGSYALTLEENVTFPAFRFLNGPSPTNRMFLVRGPVSYICNSANATRTLRRYEGYNITAGIPTTEASAQLGTGTSTLIASDIGRCSVRCSNGSTTNRFIGTLVIEFTVSNRSASGDEVIHIMGQYRVENQS
jgi:MSHA biogenesis protein MshO